MCADSRTTMQTEERDRVGAVMATTSIESRRTVARRFFSPGQRVQRTRANAVCAIGALFFSVAVVSCAEDTIPSSPTTG
jgi:hypothetical protein